MKQTNTELTFATAELIDAIEADIAEAHYRRLAAERIAARQQRSLQELRELIDGSDGERIDTPLPRGLAELKALLEDDDGDYPAAWDYAAATFAFAAAMLVFLFLF